MNVKKISIDKYATNIMEMEFKMTFMNDVFICSNFYYAFLPYKRNITESIKEQTLMYFIFATDGDDIELMYSFVFSSKVKLII